MSHNICNIKPGELFILEPRPEFESHISVLFPHWDGGNVMVTDVKESRLFSSCSTNSAGTVTLVEFLFQDRVYSEGLQDFAKRAIHVT